MVECCALVRAHEFSATTEMIAALGYEPVGFTRVNDALASDRS